MGEIQNAPFQRPSGWRRWLTGLIGQKTNPPSLNLIVPTFDQASFEKNIITLRGQVRGDGVAVAIVAFSPPANIGSFIVRSVHIENEATAVRAWEVRHNRILEDGIAYSFRRARLALLAGANMALIGRGNFVLQNGVNDAQNFTGEPFTCWRNPELNDRGESFDVRSLIAITDLNDVVVHAELEIIPDAALIRDMSQTLVTSP